MSSATWRTVSRRTILAALESGRAAGLAGKDLERHVSAAYPFGERENHPYKIWLSEFAILVRGSREPRSEKARARRRAEVERLERRAPWLAFGDDTERESE